MTRELLGLVLLGVQTALILPLIVRMLRSRDGTGISLSSETMWSVAGLGWLAYGYGTGSSTLIASGAIASAGSTAMAVLLWPGKGRIEHTSGLRVAAVAAAAIVGGTLAAGVAGLSLALSVLGAVQFIPQIVETLRTWRARAPTPGVSPVASSMRAAYTGGWAVWAGAWTLWGIGFDQIDWPLVAWGLAGAVAFGSQALVSVATARRHGDPVPLEGAPPAQLMT